MNIFNNIIRGGQLNLHQLRMLQQVIKAALIISFIISVFYFVIQIIQTLPMDNAIGGLEYLKAKCLINLANHFNIHPIKQTVVINNKNIEVSSYSIINSPFYIKSVITTQKVIIGVFKKTIIYFSIFFILIVALWFFYGKIHKKTDILKGKQFVSPHVLKKYLKETDQASDILIGDLPLVKNYEKQHILTCGTTGSGKSNLFNIVLPQIRKRLNRAVIVDVTGEYISRYYRPETDLIFNPFDARSVNWDIWSDLLLESHYEAFAESMIPDKRHSYDDVWDQSSRLVLVEILKKLAKQNQKISALNALINKSHFRELESFLSDTAANKIITKDAERTAFSVLMNLITRISSLKYLKDSDNKFSIRQWIGNVDNDSWLFISARSDQIASLRPLISTFMDISLNTILSLVPDESRRIWFIIDELPKLNKLPSLLPSLAESRKYGGCIMVGVQSLAQLADIYGYEASKTILDMFNTFFYFRSNDPQTTELISKSLGVVEQEELNEHLSYGASKLKDGISFSKQTRSKQLVLPIEIANLKSLEAYVKYAGFDITKIQMEYQNQPEIEPEFVLIDKFITEL